MTDKQTIPLVYLAGPIQAVSLEEAVYWRVAVSSYLAYAGVASFNPALAWAGTAHPQTKARDPVLERKLQSANDAALMVSNLLVVAYQGVDSVGTDSEIAIAQTVGIPIAMIDMFGGIPIQWLSTRGLLRSPEIGMGRMSQYDLHRVSLRIRDLVMGAAK